MILMSSFLYPSWNFFDRAGMSYICKIKTNGKPHFEEIYPRPNSDQQISALFVSSRNLEYLFFHSMLSNFAEKACKREFANDQILELNEYKKLLALIQNYLIENKYDLHQEFSLKLLARPLTTPESEFEIFFSTQFTFKDSQ